MKLNQIIISLPWLVLFGLACYFTLLFHTHQSPLPNQAWHYYIDSQQFQTHPQQSYHSLLKLQHDGQGHYQPLKLQIITKSNHIQDFILDDLNHTHIDQKLKIHHKNIKHAIIKSDHPLNFYNKQRIRLLASVNVQDDFVKICGNFFTVLFPLIRNSIFIGIFINKIDLFLPLVIMIEGITMLAFLDNSKHYLETFYNNIFNSYIDGFNILRLGIFANLSDKQIVAANSLIGKYGFTNNLLYNISGELFVIIGFLAATILLKVGGAIMKFQNLRTISSKLRGIWNGLLFCLMPRILTFSSFSIRDFQYINTSVNTNISNPLFGAIFIVGYLVYFVFLLLQVREINQKVQYIEENRNNIGLVTRLDYKKDFEFDCLEYSNLYYPVMNFIRLIFFYIPIGAFYDITYASFGGVIFSQLLYVMFSVSSTGYVKNRDGIIYPLCDFLMMLQHLSFIAVGLAQSVMHSQVSVIAEKVYFSLLLSIIFFMFSLLASDIVSEIRQYLTKQKNNKQKQALESDQKQQSDQKSKKRVFKKKSSIQPQSKTTLKTKFKGKQSSNQIDSDNSQDLQEDSRKNQNHNIQMDMSHLKNKVRKIRKGKVV